MKRAYPNLEMVLTSRYIQRLSFVRRFIRYWGTTTIDGVEVLNHKVEYWPNPPANAEKLGKLLNVDVLKNKPKSSDMKGVKSAWLYLNSGKYDGTSFDRDILTRNLNRALSGAIDRFISDNMEVRFIIGPKITVNSKGISKVSNVPFNTDPSLDQEAAIAELITRYSEYYYGGYYVDAEGDKYEEILTKYALLSSDVDTTIKSIRKTVTSLEIPYYLTYIDDDGFTQRQLAYERKNYSSYAVDMSISPLVFTNESEMVSKILADLSGSGFINSIGLRASLRSYDTVEGKYLPFSFGTNDTLWYSKVNEYYDDESGEVSYSEGTNYLRLSALTDRTLKLEQKVDLLNDIIDSDYRKKSANAWERFVAFVLIVVVLMLVPYTGGTSLKLLPLATYILTVTLYLTLIAAAAAYLGNPAIANELGQFLKHMDPLIKIATVVVLINTGMDIYTTGKESLMSAGVDVARVGVKDIVIEGLKVHASSLLTSQPTNLAKNYLKQGVELSVKMWQDNRLDKIADKIKDEKARLAEYEEALEQYATNHTMLELLQITFIPLNVEGSEYARLYDMPYEMWKTSYHTGNIQRTSVGATWSDDNLEKM